MSFRTMGPLPGAGFGAEVAIGGADAHAVVTAAEGNPDALPKALAEAGGLLLLKGMNAIADTPTLLLRLSALFGTEVEDYRKALLPLSHVHPAIPEILIVSNKPPVGKKPPAQPKPPVAADGGFPVQFPHRRGWHTDQSYRRPPPDISLFFGLTPVPRGQGQTLFANCADAYDALPDRLKAEVAGLEGLHTKGRTGRSYDQVLAGETPQPQRPHERSQRQPVVRTHPVTGRKSLYICEYGQMDWVDGPFVGMEPGPHGDGSRLLHALMGHITQRRFVYVHEWDAGDLLVWDNRCLVHAATWFDDTLDRAMWRTTVGGNPGAIYAGEKKSWIPADALAVAD